MFKTLILYGTVFLHVKEAICGIDVWCSLFWFRSFFGLSEADFEMIEFCLVYIGPS